MGLAEYERKKDEKINGVIYDMSPAPGFRHGIINSNIHAIIKHELKNSLCLVFMENLDFKYHPDINDDYLCPDIMIVCDRKHLKGSFYSGVPKFIVETLSPSTAKKDKTEKKDIYEQAGVEEYWIVSPRGFWRFTIWKMGNMCCIRAICCKMMRKKRIIMQIRKFV